MVGLLAVVLGLAGGATVAFGPVWAGFAALAALALAYAMLRDTMVGLGIVVFVATILPFGTLPFKAVITPNFLELALLGLMAVWLLRLLVQPEQRLELTPLGLPIVGFLGVTLFSFILGSNGSPDSLTLHNYFKFTLAVLFFFSIVNCVRTPEQARWAIRLLIVGGAISALLGLLLYALPNRTALQALVALGRIGYPTSGRVLRFVEDDPNGVERAIGLAVDPNSYGGMLALVGALAVVQAVAERPLLPRRWLIGMAGLMALTVLLTQSRGALGGLAVGALYAATLRYRKLWWPVAGALALAVGLYVLFGVGEAFVGRVTAGVQFADQANQMRLAEYRNAVAIIGTYPVFGIGFGRAPDLNLVAGVSSIYLALAERTGLVGLAAFLTIAGAFFTRSIRAMRAAFGSADREAGERRGGALLGLQAAVAAALAVGVLDHYFFNIEFSHMVALFWGTIGLALALETQNDERRTMNETRDDDLAIQRSALSAQRSEGEA
ncbi:MAG: O-antigen ligase family protein [Kouleothrix sp.]|nr:O-antigen ligase family protein [Kouleothrix sp.]